MPPAFCKVDVLPPAATIGSEFTAVERGNDRYLLDVYRQIPRHLSRIGRVGVQGHGGRNAAWTGREIGQLEYSCQMHLLSTRVSVAAKTRFVVDIELTERIAAADSDQQPGDHSFFGLEYRDVAS